MRQRMTHGCGRRRPARWSSTALSTSAALAAALLGILGGMTPLRADGIDARRQIVVDRFRPASVTVTHGKIGPYTVVGATLRDGCGPPARARFMAEVLGRGGSETELHPEIFALPPVARYVLQFPDCLGAEDLAILKTVLGRRVDHLSHGTANHVLLTAASWYLLAQRFPDVQWSGRDGQRRSSDALMAELKRLLLRRLVSQFDDGLDEQLSPTYAAINLFAILGLVDFAEDPEVREAAAAVANMMVATLRQSSFHGYLVPPLARVNFQQHAHSVSMIDGRDAPVNVSQMLLWFYYGEPARAAEALKSWAEPPYLALFAASPWRPEPEVLEIDAGRRPGPLRVVTPRFRIWDGPAGPTKFGQATLADDYAIGLGAFVFDPGGYNDGDQAFAIFYRSPDLYGYVDCYHPYYQADAGEDAWRADRSSPFGQGYLSGARGVLVYDIPARDPWTYGPENRFFRDRDEHRDALHGLVACRWPKTVDEARREATSLVLREGNVAIGLRSLAGTMDHAEGFGGNPRMTGFAALKIRQRRTAIYFRVEKLADVAGFARFAEAFRSESAAYDAATGVAAYVDEAGRRIEVSVRLEPTGQGRWVSAVPRVRVDGVEEAPPRATGVVVDGPFVQAGGGRLEVTGEATILRILRTGSRFRIDRRPRG